MKTKIMNLKEIHSLQFEAIANMGRGKCFPVTVHGVLENGITTMIVGGSKFTITHVEPHAEDEY